MKRALAALILMLTACVGPTAYGQDQAEDIPDLIDRVFDAIDIGDTQTAYRTSQILLSHEDFEDLPDYARADIYGVAGYAALYLPEDRTEEAIGYLDEAERLGTRSPMVFMARGFAHMSREVPVNAARDLMHADRLSAGLLNTLRGRDFLSLLDMLAQSDAEDAQTEYTRFVDFLLKRWKPENPFETNEYVRYHAARVAIAESNLAEAGRLVESLQFSSTRLRVQIERDFEPFWIEEPDELRAYLREGAQHSVDYYGQLASEHPGFIEPVALKAQGHVQLGNPQEAMLILQNAREQVLSGELIDDVGEQMPWLLNDMASVAEALGEFDLAIELMSQAAGLSEYNSPNVSQRVNLAFMLAMDGQQERALSEIATIDLEQTSTYGKAVILAARICANHFSDQTSQIEEDLSALQDSGMIVSALYQYAFACLDDRERGAALLIERLEHPAARTSALASLQSYLDVEGEYKGPYHALLNAHDDALLARPDVAAALERAGRLIEPGVTY